MCGFAGFAGFDENLWEERFLWGNLGKRMCARIAHRGPDDRGLHISPNCVLSHARLSVIDPLLGAQPMTARLGGKDVSIAYNGEIYNYKELKFKLQKLGHIFDTECDTEVVLKAYMEYGEDCAEMLNGIYAFAVDDRINNRIFFCRDRFGVKPLFYTFVGGRVVFASEIKGLFEYPGVNAVIDKTGLSEIFGIGPARTPGCGVFKDIFELKPGFMATFSEEGFKEKCYYNIPPRVNTDSYADATENVRYLLDDIAERQIIADVPICTFLSGGLDSSVITALVANKLKKADRTLDTYSFDYEDNESYFKASSYQPSPDEPWARLTAAHIGTNHKTLICSNDSLYKSLFDGVIAKDLPGMADVDGSLIYFSKQVKENHTVALCGECADEIFGGYPWFKDLDFKTFPWSKDIDYRVSFLKPELGEYLNLPDYIENRFTDTLMSTPVVSGEDEETIKRRQLSYLNIKWFMQTLLDRKDRCTMYNGLEVRVPYADHRLLEYVYNLPWEYKSMNGMSKSILRDASKGLLPDEILYRKKSPYPKTHNPLYEKILKDKLKYIIDDSLQPIHEIVNRDTLQKLLTEDFDYGRPWFGQLMAGPQLIAHLIQINYWLMKYDVKIEV